MASIPPTTPPGASVSSNSTMGVCHTTITTCVPGPSATPITCSAICPAVCSSAQSRSSPPQSTVTVTKTAASAQHTSCTPLPTPRISEWPTRRDLTGICIATAAVALIIGALAMLCFLKRRARKLARARAYDGSQSPQESSQLMNIAGATSTRSKTAPVPVFDNDSADGPISGLVNLGSMIQNHVESNYVLYEAQHDRDNLVQAIAGLPFLKHDAQFLAHLCSVPATRHATIRHLIAVTILSAVDFCTFHNNLLLPPAVLAFWEILPSSHGDRKHIEALWQWQKFSVALLEKQTTTSKEMGEEEEEEEKEEELSPSDALQPQVAKLRALLDPVLTNFAPGSHEERYRQSEQLEELIWAAARLGYKMLAHPVRWSFNWQAGDHEMVLLSGLLRVSNSEGEMLDKPVPVGAQITVEI